MPALVNICLYHCHLYLTFRARHINSEVTVESSDGYSVLHLSGRLSGTLCSVFFCHSFHFQLVAAVCNSAFGPEY